MTYSKLADDLGITVATLRAWRSKPDAPKTKDPDDWRSWRASQMPSQGRDTAGEADDIQSLRKELLKAQAARERANAKLREIEIEQREKRLVPESEAIEEIRRVLPDLRKLLDALPRAVAAQANPEKPAVAEVALRLALDEKIFGEIEKIYNEMEAREK